MTTSVNQAPEFFAASSTHSSHSEDGAAFSISE